MKAATMVIWHRNHSFHCHSCVQFDIGDLTAKPESEKIYSQLSPSNGSTKFPAVCCSLKGIMHGTGQSDPVAGPVIAWLLQSKITTVL